MQSYEYGYLHCGLGEQGLNFMKPDGSYDVITEMYGTMQLAPTMTRLANEGWEVITSSASDLDGGSMYVIMRRPL